MIKSLSIIALLTAVSFGTFADDSKAKKMVAKPAAVAEKKSLFDRLGGKAAIDAVVDSFVNTTAGNTKVNFFRDGKYKNIDVPHLKKTLSAFLYKVTGGPDEYKGRDMKSTHAGMKITTAEFSAIAQDLAATLDKFKVPKKEKDELMAIAASTQKDIVEVK